MYLKKYYKYWSAVNQRNSLKCRQIALNFLMELLVECEMSGPSLVHYNVSVQTTYLTAFYQLLQKRHWIISRTHLLFQIRSVHMIFYSERRENCIF